MPCTFATDLGRKDRTKTVPPIAHGLMAHIDPAFVEQIHAGNHPARGVIRPRGEVLPDCWNSFIAHVPTPTGPKWSLLRPSQDFPRSAPPGDHGESHRRQ